MTSQELLSLTRSLRANQHPLTGQDGGPDSCLLRRPVYRLIDRLYDTLQEDGGAPPPTEADLRGLIQDLKDLGFTPTLEQAVKVLAGSRTIADPRLRGLMAYKRYRGILSQRQLRDMLAPYRTLFAIEAPEAVASDWREVTFFSDEAFDKLSAGKAAELTGEVDALALRKPTDRLPAYMVKARKRYPRAYEPWTREEKALLIEAMCYTSRSERLEPIFGRSSASIERQGKQLIWASQQRDVA